MSRSLDKYADMMRVEDRSSHGEVSTPLSLAVEMIDQIPEAIFTSDSTTFLDPFFGNGTFIIELIKRLRSYGHSMESIQKRIYGCEISKRLFNKVKKKLAKYNFDGIIYEDSLSRDFDMKFDVVIGNPPYQISHGGSAGSPIWHKFVVLADSLLNEGGYISFVHPDGWRAGKTTFDCVSKMFKDRYNLEWLRLGDYARGRSYFGQSVGTTADVYVAKKTSERKLTKLVDVNDEEMEIDLSEAYFIPDCNIEEVSKFLAGPDDDKIEQLGGEYGTMKPFVKYAARKGDVVTDDHKYPVVWSITKGGGVNLAYSDRNDLGHYGVAKAIISNGAGAYAIADPKGEYACSEFAWNIVDTPENVVKITKALNNPRFHELMKQLGAGNWKYSRTGLKNLKKDFWKHFQD